MESIYDPATYSSSEHVNLKEYFEQYKNACYKNTKRQTLHVKNANQRFYKAFKDLNIGIPNESLKNLDSSCSLDLLDDDDSVKQVDLPDKVLTTTEVPEVYKMNSKAAKFQCVKKRLEFNKILKKEGINPMISPQYYTTFPLITHKASTSNCINLTPGEDLIISITIFKPMCFSSSKKYSERVRYASTIEVLGSNTLDQVADKIKCIADLGLYKEVESVEEDLTAYLNAKEHYPSSSFFIDGVFYNDMRSPNAVDYSEEVIKWGASKGIKNFTASVMETTKINDLKPRFGYPYVYMHQGDCEHIVSFADARLLQEFDCLDANFYPFISNNVRKSNNICNMCNKDFAKWFCTESDRLPQEKFYFCTDCCESYNFIDRKRVGNFKLFPLYEAKLCKDVDEDE